MSAYNSAYLEQNQRIAINYTLNDRSQYSVGKNMLLHWRIISIGQLPYLACCALKILSNHNTTKPSYS